MSTATKQLSVIRAFTEVYVKSFKGTCPNIVGFANEMKYLMMTYQLSPAAIVVLSYLLLHIPSEIGATKLNTIIQQWCETPKDVLKVLTERDFLERRAMSEKGKYCYSISPGAKDAFLNNRPYLGGLFEDCFAELKATGEKAINTDKWLARFTKSLALPANKQFCIASDKLRICSFPNDVQKAFWVMAKHFIHHFTAPFDSFNGDGAGTIGQMMTLCKAGIVIDKEDGSFVLAPHAAGLLFGGHDEIVRYDELSRFATIVKSDQVVKMDLFFSAHTQNEIDSIRKVLTPEGYDRAMNILDKKKRARSIICLFWGPPGTGKTESVKQLAAESGRDMFVLNASKLVDKMVGESEKHYTDAFLAYKYIASVCGNKTPILFLNEADSILSTRLNRLGNSADKSENTITDILLHEIENFHGILFATTNLMDNLDTAFYRRFLFKAEMTKPDSYARMQIWWTNIPELSMDEAIKLAQLEMSGAQISNVAVKRDIAEIYYDGDRGLDYILELCKQELATENGSDSSRRRIGF